MAAFLEGYHKKFPVMSAASASLNSFHSLGSLPELPSWNESETFVSNEPYKEEVCFLDKDLSNIPPFHKPLPKVVMFKGNVLRDPERIKLAFRIGRRTGRIPLTVFSDPLPKLLKTYKRKFKRRKGPNLQKIKRKLRQKKSRIKKTLENVKTQLKEGNMIQAHVPPMLASHISDGAGSHPVKVKPKRASTSAVPFKLPEEKVYKIIDSFPALEDEHSTSSPKVSLDHQETQTSPPKVSLDHQETLPEDPKTIILSLKEDVYETSLREYLFEDANESEEQLFGNQDFQIPRGSLNDTLIEGGDLIHESNSANNGQQLVVSPETKSFNTKRSKDSSQDQTKSRPEEVPIPRPISDVNDSEVEMVLINAHEYFADKCVSDATTGNADKSCRADLAVTDSAKISMEIDDVIVLHEKVSKTIDQRLPYTKNPKEEGKHASGKVSSSSGFWNSLETHKVPPNRNNPEILDKDTPEDKDQQDEVSSIELFVLDKDLSNIPSLHKRLPKVVMFEGNVLKDPERIKLAFRLGRRTGRIPSSVFSDPLPNLLETHGTLQEKCSAKRKRSRAIPKPSTKSRLPTRGKVSKVSAVRSSEDHPQKIVSDFVSLGMKLVNKASRCSSEEDPKVQDILVQDAEVPVAVSLIKILAKALGHRMQDSLQSYNTKDLENRVLQAKAAHHFLTSRGTVQNVSTSAPQQDTGQMPPQSSLYKAELIRQKFEKGIQEQKAALAEPMRSKAVGKDMKKALQSYKTAKDVAKANSSPLQLLRDFLITQKKIYSDNDSVWFGDFGFPANCKVNIKPYKSGSGCYTLGALNHFMKFRPNKSSYMKYRAEAIRKGFTPIQPMDVESISDYLQGFKHTIPGIFDASHKYLNPGLFTHSSTKEWAKRLQDRKLKQKASSIIEEKHVTSALGKSRFDLPFHPSFGLTQPTGTSLSNEVPTIQTQFHVLSGQTAPNLKAVVSTGHGFPISSYGHGITSNEHLGNQQPCNWQDRRSPTFQRVNAMHAQSVSMALSSPRSQFQEISRTRNSRRPSKDDQRVWNQHQNHGIVESWFRDEKSRSPSRSRSPAFKINRSRSPTFQTSVRPTTNERRESRSSTSHQILKPFGTVYRHESSANRIGSKSRSPDRYSRPQGPLVSNKPKPQSPIMWNERRITSPTWHRDLRSRSPNQSSFTKQDSSVTSLMSNLIKSGLIEEQRTLPDKGNFAVESELPKRSMNPEFSGTLDRELSLHKIIAWPNVSESPNWSWPLHRSEGRFGQNLDQLQSFPIPVSHHSSSYRSNLRASPENHHGRDAQSRAQWDSYFSSQEKSLFSDPDFGSSSYNKGFLNLF